MERPGFLREIRDGLSLRQAGRTSEALSLFEDLSQRASSPEERGLAQGEAGHVLQSAGLHVEAIDRYERAARSFHECADERRALLAVISAAVSYRLMGDLKQSEHLLRDLLGKDALPQDVNYQA